MTFVRNKYLSWYMPRARAHDGAINLHSSGVPPLDPASFVGEPGDPWTAVPRFEAALAAWLELTPEELIFTPGGTGGTLLALLTMTGSDGHVLVECPIYEPMRRQAERLCRTERLIRRPESDWRLPLEDIEKLIVAETRLVMITEPHNPSGRFAPSQDVLELAEMARRRRAILLINEVYRGFSDRPSYQGMAENIVVVSSLSKLVGAYWARLGWLSGSPEIVAQLRRAHQNFSMPSSPGAEVGLAVLAQATALREQAVALARAGQPLVEELVQTTPGLSWSPPQGPGYGCLGLPEGSDDVDLADRLHREQGVLTVPGSFFEAPSSLRVAWLQAGERLTEGLQLLGEALGRLVS